MGVNAYEMHSLEAMSYIASGYQWRMEGPSFVVTN